MSWKNSTKKVQTRGVTINWWNAFTSVWIEGHHLIEAHVIHDPVAKRGRRPRLLAHVVLLIDHLLTTNPPALAPGVINLRTRDRLLVLHPTSHHQLIVAPLAMARIIIFHLA